MYTPPMFKPDRAASLGFAEARGFGMVCAEVDGRRAAVDRQCGIPQEARAAQDEQARTTSARMSAHGF